MSRLANPTGKPVVLFAENYGGNAVKDIERMGGIVVKDIKDLIGLVR